MTGLRVRSTLVALVAALSLAVVAPAIGVLEPSAVRGAATDLTLITDATYTVDVDAGHVGVSLAVAAKNRTTETRTRRFWFDHAFLAVQPGATNLRVTGLRGARVRVARKDDKSTLLRIDFGTRLYSGKGATFRLAFDLPGRGTAASRQVRVGTSLIAIPVWAYASSGARGSSVTVRMPAGWEVAVESGSFAGRTTADSGVTVLESGPLASPLTFFAYVSAQQPALYVDHPLTLPVGDREVELVLQAWEDDAAWATRTGELLGGALPILRRDIGLPWPLAEPLIVAESVSRDAGANAGLFDPAEGRMEIAYWAGPDVIIQQAAHGWFNGSLLADRWVNEGFATFYALRAAAGMDMAVTAPELTDEVGTAAVPLNAWTRDEPAGSAVDTYGYAASLALATALAERLGTDVLALAWADAQARIGAYQPPAAAGTRAGATTPDAPETLADAPDWRGLLDLLEARSGKDLTGLWRRWVVGPDEAAQLDARAEARASYARTLALADGWRLPRPVRDALRAWDFEGAEALMADVRTVIAQRNAVARMAERDGVTLTTRMQGLFESGALAEASAQAEAQRVAMVAIEDAEAARSADDDILSRIGMLGEHPEQSIREARLLLAQDDFEGSMAASDRALRAWTVAWQEGRRRALLALAVLATVLVLLTAGIGSIRRARRPAAGPTTVAGGAATSDVPSAVPTAVPASRPVRRPSPPVRPATPPLRPPPGGHWPGDV
ncbi:MAG TPA: hypothetical protein VES19_06190 [Candidatus Limnocylindrales bacterium]|nr:hypothetical protein [Candidatus Limnocylindrales bacterium]